MGEKGKTLFMEGESIILLQGSQALSDRPSDVGMRVEILGGEGACISNRNKRIAEALFFSLLKLGKQNVHVCTCVRVMTEKKIWFHSLSVAVHISKLMAWK
jgi:ribosomal protein L39E